jgi:hypothetical protein
MPHQSILSGSGACPSLSSPLQCGCAWDRLVSSPSRTDRCGLHSRLALVRTYAVRRVQSAAFERFERRHIFGTYNGVNAVYAAVYANYAVHYACSFAANAHTPFVDRLPQPWDLWIRWNVGDTQNQVPPLRSLVLRDYRHLDKLRDNISPGTKKPELARNTLYHMKLLCNWIERVATEKGEYQRGASVEAYGRMFDKVASHDNGLLLDCPRGTSLVWRTVANNVKAIQKKARDAAKAAAEAEAMAVEALQADGVM